MLAGLEEASPFGTRGKLSEDAGDELSVTAAWSRCGRRLGGGG